MRVYRQTVSGLIALLLLTAIAPAITNAHFVWLGMEEDDAGHRTAHVWFGETTAPGEGELIEKIAATELWAVSKDGTRRKLSHKTVVTGDEGALVSSLDQPCEQLMARIDYGVIDRGDGPFLLKYFARCIPNLTSEATANTPKSRLPCDVEASLKGDRILLTVLADGKVSPGAEVVIETPRGKSLELTTDEQGNAEIELGRGDRFSIRAKVVVPQRGEFEGEKYDEIRSYATLNVTVAAPSAVSGTETPVEALGRAREARAEWKEFPGFTADASIYADGKTQHGQLTVTSKGKVELSGFESKLPNVVRTLRSMVMHRLAGSAESGPVSWVREEHAHPLGRLVKLDYDTAMGSTYRIRGNIIRQVNRESDGGHFTISVLDVAWNEEGKYLPAEYTVTFWNEDGSLQSSSSVRESWRRVGEFDLPTQHFVVSVAGEDKLDYLRMEFDNHRLLSE